VFVFIYRGQRYLFWWKEI